MATKQDIFVISWVLTLIALTILNTGVGVLWAMSGFVAKFAFEVENE